MILEQKIKLPRFLQKRDNRVVISFVFSVKSALANLCLIISVGQRHINAVVEVLVKVGVIA